MASPSSAPRCWRLAILVSCTLFSLHTVSGFELSKQEEDEHKGSRRRLISSQNLCFERVYTGSPLNLKPHPAHKEFALMADQAGLIQLVRLPTYYTNTTVTTLRVISTWLNLTSRTYGAGERGLLGIAFHPKYLDNGRFFVSYICNSNKFADCQGPCACNAKIGCTVGVNGATCNSNTVIAEYRVRNPRGVYSKPSPLEASRILTFGRPFENHNGGDIFFGPYSGYLLYTSGDGGNSNDPYNAAQAGSSMLGKILRIDVDKKSGGKNYSVPSSNPFFNTTGVLPELYALGLRNPFRCSLDAKNAYLFCGDVGQRQVEEIDRIQIGYNYGWPKFEGTVRYKSGVTTSIGRKVESPVFQYAHYGVKLTGIPEGGNCVTGGIVYRAPRNTCLQGKYIYNDLGGTLFVGTVYPPAGSKPSTTQVQGICSPRTRIACDVWNGKPDFGLMWSWGFDNEKNPYMLTSNGVYRIAPLSNCGIAC